MFCKLFIKAVSVTNNISAIYDSKRQNKYEYTDAKFSFLSVSRQGEGKPVIRVKPVNGICFFYESVYMMCERRSIRTSLGGI